MSGPRFPVLIGRDAIAARIAELADAIVRAHPNGLPTLVAVIEGARRFASELTARLPGRPRFGEVRAASYGSGVVSRGSVEVSGEAGLELAGRDVLILEDIVDTGRTVAALRARFAERGARSVRVATLLSKPSRRVVPVELDHVGFEIEDHFVIGFGMDFDGKYRELEEVVVYDAAVERASPPSAR